MPEVIPFRGILYNQNKIKTLAEVAAPPYDVISSQQRKNYYRRNKYNIIRLILSPEHLRDGENNNKYTRAAGVLNNWLREEVLSKDRRPSIYLYTQQYYYRGEKRIRRGFIALMKIEDFHKSSVLPHEHTFVKPKRDRLNLLREVKANLSPIFSLFSDNHDQVSALIEKHCRQSRPCINFEQEKVRHKLWRLSHKLTIDKITNAMKNKQIFIADGHHRYEAAMEFCHEMNVRPAGESDLSRPCADKYNYVMVYFAAFAQDGLTVLPTHRLIGDLPRGADKHRLKKKFELYFKLTKFDHYLDMLSSMEKEAQGGCLFGMYQGGDFYLLRLKNKNILDSVIGKEESPQWKKLDVAILHRLILEQILRLKHKPENIAYTRDPAFAVRMVDRGKYKIVFFVNPVKISQVKAIAASGIRMPHKSTYFYPKAISGLVINKF